MKFTTSLRVRYSETDQMGVVYHGNYFSWFEVGRVELLRQLGLSYQALEADEDCVLPVVEASCRYRKPARYDDLLTLETTVKAMRGPILLFGYALYKEQLLLAEGETKHVIVDRALTRRRLPPRYHAAMLEILEK
jgi:acyl-CoA thioester hydrolase